MSNFRDLTGQRFGRLEVESIHSKSRSGQYRWNCLCDCGVIKDVLSTHLISGKTNSCGCLKNISGAKHKDWEGCGEISGNKFCSIKRSANGSKRREIEFDLAIEYLWKLFLGQHRMCALSGIEIWFDHTDGHSGDCTASLDRIDSGRGYVAGNVQWVHKDVNKMKNSLDQEYFIQICKCISLNSRPNPIW